MANRPAHSKEYVRRQNVPCNRALLGSVKTPVLRDRKGQTWSFGTEFTSALFTVAAEMNTKDKREVVCEWHILCAWAELIFFVHSVIRMSPHACTGLLGASPRNHVASRCKRSHIPRVAHIIQIIGLICNCDARKALLISSCGNTWSVLFMYPEGWLIVYSTF